MRCIMKDFAKIRTSGFGVSETHDFKREQNKPANIKIGLIFIDFTITELPQPDYLLRGTSTRSQI